MIYAPLIQVCNQTGAMQNENWKKYRREKNGQVSYGWVGPTSPEKNWRERKGEMKNGHVSYGREEPTSLRKINNIEK